MGCTSRESTELHGLGSLSSYVTFVTSSYSGAQNPLLKYKGKVMIRNPHKFFLWLAFLKCNSWLKKCCFQKMQIGRKRGRCWQNSQFSSQSDCFIGLGSKATRFLCISKFSILLTALTCLASWEHQPVSFWQWAASSLLNSSNCSNSQWLWRLFPRWKRHMEVWSLPFLTKNLQVWQCCEGSCKHHSRSWKHELGSVQLSDPALVQTSGVWYQGFYFITYLNTVKLGGKFPMENYHNKVLDMATSKLFL